MKEIEAIIILSIRYCIDKYNYWVEKYKNERTGNNYTYTYTSNDYNLFPRYNTLNAIREGIEELVGKEFKTIEECKNQIIDIGKNYNTIFTDNQNNEIAKKAILDERNKFVLYVELIDFNKFECVEPLPYKRKLSKEESNHLRDILKCKWSFNGSYWFPLQGDFKNAVFISKASIDEQQLKEITGFIKNLSQDHAYIIAEDLVDYEIEKSLIDIDGYEEFVFDSTNSWIVYSSHEGTISFAGDKLKKYIEVKFSKSEDILNVWK
jgi:hypothetical protein